MPRRPEPSDYFTPPIPVLSEAQLRERVVVLAHAYGWKVFSLPISKTRRPVKNASGYPDLTLARYGRVLFIELKQEKGVLSEEQLRWMRELPDCFVIRPSNLPALDGMLR